MAASIAVIRAANSDAAALIRAELVAGSGAMNVAQYKINYSPLSLTGGVIGVVVGLIAAGSVRSVLKWAAIISPGAILLAVGVAAAVSVFFGLYPARQASRLDPIDALRFE